MKINGFEYTEEEILEALKKKGYQYFVKKEFAWEDESFPNGICTMRTTELCAMRDAAEPQEKDIYQNVAIREFQKDFLKPPLV